MVNLNVSYNKLCYFVLKICKKIIFLICDEKPGVLPTFTISGGQINLGGVKSVILYIKFISSYKICKKKFALGGGHVPL